MINKFASVGASIATIIAETTVTCIQLYVVRKDIDVKEVALKVDFGVIICSWDLFVSS